MPGPAVNDADEARPKRLVLTLRFGEKIDIGGIAKMTIRDAPGRRVQVVIESLSRIRIERDQE